MPSEPPSTGAGVGPVYRIGSLAVQVEGPADPYFVEAGDGAVADVTFRRGRVTADGPWTTVGSIVIDGDQFPVERGPGGHRLRWTDWFDAVVLDGGGRVVVEEHVPDAGLTRALLTVVLPVVLGYWGRVTLHASAVQVGGVAVVAAGASGCGKSTLAAALCRQGACLLADDLTVARLDGSGLVVAEPTSRSTRLFPGTAADFGYGTGGAGDGPKQLVGGTVTGEAAPVGLFVVLDPGPARTERRRGGAAAVEVLRLMPAAVDPRPDWQALRLEVATAIAGQADVLAVTWEPSAADAMALAGSLLGTLGAIR